MKPFGYEKESFTVRCGPGKMLILILHLLACESASYVGNGNRYETHNRGSPMSECQSHSQSCRNSPNRIVRHRVCSPVDRWWTRAPCYVTTTSFRGRPKKPRPHTGTTRSHTHTLYGKHDRNPVGALRGRTTPPSLRPNPSRVLPEGFERIPQRIVCGYPCLVGLLLASYRLRQQRRYQCAYELTNKEQVITNSSPTIPA